MDGVGRKENAHSFGGMSIVLSVARPLADQRIRLMGESASTVSQPSKPVSDWSLGLARVEVKGIFSGSGRWL